MDGLYCNGKAGVYRDGELPGWRWQPGTEMVEEFDCVAEWASSD